MRKTASAPNTKAGRKTSSATRKKPDRTPPRVLVVEDDAVTQFVALRQLEKLECIARGASNGFAVLEACRSERFDLILMDCQMPYLDGYETCRSIRTHERSAPGERVTIVAITAESEPACVDKCMSAGMDGYFSKPIGMDGMRALCFCASCKQRNVRPNRAPASPPAAGSLLPDVGRTSGTPERTAAACRAPFAVHRIDVERFPTRPLVLRPSSRFGRQG